MVCSLGGVGERLRRRWSGRKLWCSSGRVSTVEDDPSEAVCGLLTVCRGLRFAWAVGRSRRTEQPGFGPSLPRARPRGRALSRPSADLERWATSRDRFPNRLASGTRTLCPQQAQANTPIQMLPFRSGPRVLFTASPTDTARHRRHSGAATRFAALPRGSVRSDLQPIKVTHVRCAAILVTVTRWQSPGTPLWLATLGSGAGPALVAGPGSGAAAKSTWASPDQGLGCHGGVETPATLINPVFRKIAVSASTLAPAGCSPPPAASGQTTPGPACPAASFNSAPSRRPSLIASSRLWKARSAHHRRRWRTRGAFWRGRRPSRGSRGRDGAVALGLSRAQGDGSCAIMKAHASKPGLRTLTVSERTPPRLHPPSPSQTSLAAALAPLCPDSSSAFVPIATPRLALASN